MRELVFEPLATICSPDRPGMCHLCCMEKRPLGNAFGEVLELSVSAAYRTGQVSAGVISRSS